MEIHTIGIDLGKTVFHLVGLNPRGEVVVRKKCSRNQILLTWNGVKCGKALSNAITTLKSLLSISSREVMSETKNEMSKSRCLASRSARSTAARLESEATTP